MNKLTIIGNLTRDPELRTANTANGPVSVCSFGVAVNSRRRGTAGQEETTFFNVTAWRALGENCAKFLAKGRKVAVVGPVSARTYQASDGTTRVSLEVQADDVEFLSSRNDDSANGGYAAPAAQPAPTAQNDGFTAVEETDLPF
ncbi:MAG: single-stranded DNA-binding protein [Clostridia bacterium]|nr:single-stranded DNA-binding protein [Clostridia bacterium]